MHVGRPFDNPARRARRTMKLLTADRFEPVLEPLLGHPVGYVPACGGAGHRLVEMATLQLFAHFGIDYLVETLGDHAEPARRQIVLPGGGVGPIVPPEHRERLRSLADTVPVTLLPPPRRLPSRSSPPLACAVVDDEVPRTVEIM